MKVLSLGWGVQSWTLAAKIALGELEPVDYAAHSDTTFEREETYAFAQEWTPWLESKGVKVVTVCDERATNIMKLSEKSGNHYTLMPVFTLDEDGNKGQLRRQCTSRWKIEPLHRWLKETGATQVEMWLGISLDEWTRAKDSTQPWITNKYPLLDLNMARIDCLNWLRKRGLPSPGKSACVQCPYHSPAYWRDMKKIGGANWENAVAADKELRKDGRTWFLHPRCAPLTNAVDIPEDYGYSQLGLLEEECDSGHCFL